MNEASTSRSLFHGTSRFLRRDSISSAAVTLYTVTFFAASFFGIIGWRPYVPMALFAFVAMVVGPRVYHLAGAIALLIAVEAGRIEYREEQRYQQSLQMFATPDAK